MPRSIKYICIFYNFSTLGWCRCLKSFPLENKDPFILHGQCCLWSGNARIQGINNHGINLVIQQCSAFSAKRLLSTLKSIQGTHIVWWCKNARTLVCNEWPLLFLEMSPRKQCWAISKQNADHRLALQWRHNERHGISNHRCLECLLNGLFRRTSKKTSNSSGLCGEIHRSPVDFPHKGPVTRKMFPFDDVIMVLKCQYIHVHETVRNYIYINNVEPNRSLNHLTRVKRGLLDDTPNVTDMLNQSLKTKKMITKNTHGTT